MKDFYNILVKKMYKVELNGVAIVGFLVASFYGLVFLGMRIVDAFQ